MSVEDNILSGSEEWYTSQTQVCPIMPTVGMIFGSPDEAYEFYKLYARQTGFGITRRTSHNFYGIKYDVTFSCNKNRKPSAEPDEGFAARTRGILGTGCRARIVVRDRALKGCWVIEEALLEHNHDLNPDCVRLMRCHRQLPAFVKKQLEINELAGLAQNKSIQAVFTQSGGVTHCSFTEKDMRNYISEVRRLQLKHGDAAALMKYFRKQQQKCPNFFFDPDIDDDGRLKNVFWADARSRAAYKYFGDVITFDTTYLTNRYRMPFAVFVGVNHHGQSILLGCALLSNELKESFQWCFSALLECMNGKAPEAIITDKCYSIGAAVKSTLPFTRHRLCLWHILKKVPEKLAGVRNKDQVLNEVCEAVYDSREPEEFEYKWMNLLANVNWGTHGDWFNELFEIREKWVPAFVTNQFWVGMSTTQRSEGMNAFFDSYVNSKTSLKSFVEKYDVALHAKWEKERQEDYRCQQLKPKLVTSCGFEKQFADVYTFGMFYQYQKEIKLLMMCFCEAIADTDNPQNEFVVRELTNPRPFRVVIHNGTNEYKCSCRFFEFRGIVCRHALCVYRQLGVDRLPDVYVMDRWRKDYVRSHISQAVPDLPVLRGLSNYDATFVSANNLMLDLVEIAAQSKTLPLELINGLQTLKTQLFQRFTLEAPVVTETRCNSSDSENDPSRVRDPIITRSKGRPRSTRMKSGIEKNMAKNAQRARRKKAKQSDEPSGSAANNEHPAITTSKGRPATARMKSVNENCTSKSARRKKAKKTDQSIGCIGNDEVMRDASQHWTVQEPCSALDLLMHFQSFADDN